MPSPAERLARALRAIVDAVNASRVPQDPLQAFFQVHTFMPLLENAEAALAEHDASASAQGDWQPISTAPDETPDGVLIYCPHLYQGKGGTLCGMRMNGKWVAYPSLISAAPTHWQPHPAAPAAKG
jgi:hypothetical protein